MADPQPSTSQQAMAPRTQSEAQQQQKQESRARRKRRLSMNQKKNKKKNFDVAEEIETCSPLLEPLVQALRDCPEGEELNVLIETLQPTASNVELALRLVKDDMRRVISFPNNPAQIYEFGSIKSGLALRDSDLDFYIHYSRKNTERDEQIKLIHVVGGRMEKEGSFTDIVKILGAKVPLLRVVHRYTNLFCDINFSNARGCYNSKFINALMLFDQRIHQLAIVIKFWAQNAFVLDSRRQLNSYCLVMMLIFYLQTRKLPLIPSVEEMQQGIPRIEYGPWNLGYPSVINYKSWNENSVRDLLSGFFRYYAEFDFAHNLISPFVGRLCSLEELTKKNIRELAPYYRACEREDYPELVNGPWITIQDPFELNLNVAKVMSVGKVFEQLRVSLRHAAEVCYYRRDDSLAKLLEALFTDTKQYMKAKPVGKESKEEPAKNAANGLVEVAKEATGAAADGKASTAPVTYSVRCKLPPIEAELFLVQQVLLVRDPEHKTVVTDARIRHMWGECMLDFIVDILRKLFMVQMDPIEHPTTSAAATEENAKGEGPVVRSFIITCERQVFIARKRINIVDEATLQGEINISKSRWDRNHALRFSAPIELALVDGVVEVRAPNDKPKNGGPFRLFIDTCFVVHIRKCVRGYFMVMLEKAKKKAATDAHASASQSNDEATGEVKKQQDDDAQSAMQTSDTAEACDDSKAKKNDTEPEKPETSDMPEAPANRAVIEEKQEASLAATVEIQSATTAGGTSSSS
ncbi:uncharacterized protein LOC131205574 [Anopheles bellator]|uniref:uncharacterized protein LOC131205574 n=1 Tax=Anopheles bellator TaxID=139047 RepID=UPI0026488473|nr:uncharacterized protein LOC131205574 [Anopheles bellator]